MWNGQIGSDGEVLNRRIESDREVLNRQIRSDGLMKNSQKGRKQKGGCRGSVGNQPEK